MELTDKQYDAFLTLFHECHDAFIYMPAQYQEAFFKRLYQK